MAGTLTVQTLQGPSSGANANKLLIPSGQTLDVSSGTLVPSAGAVVQLQRVQSVSNLGSITSTSFVEFGGSQFELTFTPKYATSLLEVRLECQVYTTGTGNPYSSFTIYRDGVDQIGATYGFGYLQVINTSNAQHCNGSILINANSTAPTVFTAAVMSGSGQTANLGGGNLRAITVMEIAQ